MATFPFSTLLVTFSVTLLLVLRVNGQETPSCAQSLVPCANYINSTNPPSSCCGPLKTAIDTQLMCLCNLYNTPGLLKSFGINITEALLLPKQCKLSGGLDSCVKDPFATNGTDFWKAAPDRTPGRLEPSSETWFDRHWKQLLVVLCGVVGVLHLVWKISSRARVRAWLQAKGWTRVIRN